MGFLSDDHSYISEICAVTGSDDILYSSTNITMEEVLNSSVLKDHTLFYVLDGAEHDFDGNQRYLYQALKVWFPSE